VELDSVQNGLKTREQVRHDYLRRTYVTDSLLANSRASNALRESVVPELQRFSKALDGSSSGNVGTTNLSSPGPVIDGPAVPAPPTQEKRESPSTLNSERIKEPEVPLTDYSIREGRLVKAKKGGARPKENNYSSYSTNSRDNFKNSFLTRDEQQELGARLAEGSNRLAVLSGLRCLDFYADFESPQDEDTLLVDMEKTSNGKDSEEKKEKNEQESFNGVTQTGTGSNANKSEAEKSSSDGIDESDDSIQYLQTRQKRVLANLHRAARQKGSGNRSVSWQSHRQSSSTTVGSSRWENLTDSREYAELWRGKALSVAQSGMNFGLYREVNGSQRNWFGDVEGIA
jgi:hypothetical protein